MTCEVHKQGFVFLLGKGDCLLKVSYLAVELKFINGIQYRTELRSRRESKFDQMPAQQYWVGRLFFDLKLSHLFDKPLLGL